MIERAAAKPTYDQESLQRSARQARNAADRAATLTQQLLAFSRKQRLDGRVLNLNTMVDEFHEVAERALGNAKVRLTLDPDLWNCRIDPTQAEVAFLNILLNARDALDGRQAPTVSIDTKNVIVDGLGSMSYDGLMPGRYVSIAITDNGFGMPSSIRSRVMDPFFTTKEEGKGTGLGLSMVYGFAKQSGGSVRIYSEEDVGTTLRLYFPADDSQVFNALPKKLAREGNGTERILVVDDRPDVAELAKMLLEDYGYAADIALNAHDALGRMEATHYELLFTDLIMPGGMNGVMLAREARRRKPGIKVLLTTGYAESSLAYTDVGGSEFKVISKPYMPNELARKVRLVIDGPPSIG